jgi:pilus assembly protein Flp/PilA
LGDIVFNSALARLGAVLQSRLVREDKGATAVEYGLIVGLIAIAIIAAVIALGGTLNGLFENVNDEIADNLP